VYLRLTKVTFNGRAIVQAVSRRLLTAEARVCARICPYGICGGQSYTGTDFLRVIRFSTCQYHSTVALHTRISPGNEQ
jgi:hypothetical protein